MKLMQEEQYLNFDGFGALFITKPLERTRQTGCCRFTSQEGADEAQRRFPDSPELAVFVRYDSSGGAV